MALGAQNYVTMLGCGGEAEPSLCISTKTERIIFNCPEGMQRLMTEHKLKITNKLHGAFFTRGSWHSCSGMTDIILKCAEEGQTRLKLVGPSIRDYALSTSYFLGQRPDMTLELCSLPSYSDSCLDSLQTTVLPGGTRVTSMLISPLPPRSKRPHSEISTADDASAAGLRRSGEETPTMSELALCYSPYHRRSHTRRPCEGHAGSNHRDDRPQGVNGLDAKTSVCYIAELPGLPGKLDVKKAKELGVPQGPLLGKLVKGESVTLPDGTVISPDQCVAVGKPAGVVIVLDCPTVQHITNLRMHPKLSKHLEQTAAGKGEPSDLLVVVHLSSRQVVHTPQYEDLAKLFPAHTTHIVADQGHAPQRPLLCASERYIRLLHGVAPSLFPLSHAPYPALAARGPAISGTLTPAGDALLPGALAAWPMLRFALLPHKTPGLVTDLPETCFMHRYCLRSCVCGDGSEPPSVPGKVPSKGWRVVFLGTGASAPFKYRTTSSILLSLPSNDAGEEGGDVMLDAGDGSYGAMVRKWGLEGANERLKKLKMLWVSHKHADHICGVARLLLKRREAFGGAHHGDAPRPCCACSVCGAEFGRDVSLDMHVRACHPREKHVRTPGEEVVHGGERREGGALLIVGPMWLEAWLLTLSSLEPGLDYDFVDAQVFTSGAGGSGGRGLDGEKVRAAVDSELRAVLVQHSFPSYGLVLKHSSGFSCVYSGDTRPCDDLVAAGQDSTLLLHEATHADDMQAKAVSDRHCTVEEAVDVASRMNCNHVILTHFSSRFEKLIPDLRKYGSKASNIACALDGMEVCAEDAAGLPAISQKISDVLAGEYADGDDDE